MKYFYSAVLLLLLSIPLINIWYKNSLFFDLQNFSFYIITLVSIVIILIRSFLIKTDLQVKIYYIDLIVASILILIYLRYSFLDIYSIHSNVFISIFSFSLLYFLLRSIDNESHLIERIIYSAVPVIGILLCFHALLQYLNVIERDDIYFKFDGTFHNPSTFTNFLSLLLPIVVIGLKTKPPHQGRIYRVINYISFSMILFILVLGGERTSWLSAGIGLIVIFYNRQIIGKNAFFLILRKYRIALISITLCCLVVFSYLLFSLRPSSVIGRFLIYENTFNIIKDHFFGGIGPGKFSGVYNLYQSDFFRHHSNSNKALLASNTVLAFNEYLQFFSEVGAVGVVCLITLIIYFCRSIYKRKLFKTSPYSIGIVTGVISIAIASFFSYPLRITVILIYLFVFLSTFRSNEMVIAMFRIKLSLKRCINIIILIITFSFSFIIYNNAVYQMKWESLAINSEGTIGQDTLKKYKSVSKYLNNNESFLYNYGVILIKQHYYTDGINNLNNAKKYMVNPDLLIYLGDGYLGIRDYKKAESAYLTAYFMIPKTFLPKYALMQFYQKTNNPKAYLIAENILSEKVLFPSEKVDFIQSEALNLIEKCDLTEKDN